MANLTGRNNVRDLSDEQVADTLARADSRPDDIARDELLFRQTRYQERQAVAAEQAARAAERAATATAKYTRYTFWVAVFTALAALAAAVGAIATTLAVR